MKRLIIPILLIGLVTLISLRIGYKGNGGEVMGEEMKKDTMKETMKDVIDTVSSKHTVGHLPDNPNNSIEFNTENLKDIYLAGGCFWGLEAYMSRLYGVYDVTSGYANGDTENPSYEDLIYRSSGHAETVHIKYDPDMISLDKILDYYYTVIDPTSINKQGNDKGSQYRTGIYYTNPNELNVIEDSLSMLKDKYTKPIAIEVMPLDHYYLAEDYHQDYLEKNPNGYCHIDLNSLEDDNNSVYNKPSDGDLQDMLTPLQYEVTQNAGTESPFANEFWDHKEPGIYVDVVTGEPLFSSTDKYQSNSGWPSFTKPIDTESLKEDVDHKLSVPRTEIKSKSGDTHLGHVFNDGPQEAGGMRYCVNSASLKFIHYDDMDAEGYGHLKHLVK